MCFLFNKFGAQFKVELRMSDQTPLLVTPNLLQVFGHTWLSKQWNPNQTQRILRLIRVYTVCHSSSGILTHHRNDNHMDLLASVAQLDAPSDWRPGGRGFNPRRGRQHSFVEIDHEIFSTVILSLPLIQEGQLSVSGERMHTILVNRLED